MSEEEKRPLQQIFFGAPGTGKSYTIEQLTQGNEERCVRTTFHPDSDYSTFVGAYKPTMKEVPLRDAKIGYEFVPQAFLQAYTAAWKDLENPHYLIIEEINRGNCAQIFGDLFQLLDRDNTGFSEYPINADADIQKYLKKEFKDENKKFWQATQEFYFNKHLKKEFKEEDEKVLMREKLVLPNNLYIWATMNTSDQSLFPMDSAFKRRWEWKYIPISDAGEKYIIQVNDNIKYDWWSFLEQINGKIEKITESEDKKLGYFFVKAGENEIISAETFVSKVIFYLWNDVFKDYGYDDECFKDNEGKLTFQKFFDPKNGIMKNKVQVFLDNLGVKKVEETKREEVKEEDSEGEDSEGEEEENKSGNDNSKYSINGDKGEDGKGYDKRGVILALMKDYIKKNPNKNAQEVIKKWNEWKKDIKTDNQTNFILNATDYKNYKENSKDKKERYFEIDIHGEKIYLSNQWRKEHMNSVIEKAEKAWGIKIEKINEDNN